MRINSLRLQLLAWVVLPLAGLLTINLWTSQHNAQATADLVTDRMLVGSARAIAEQVAMEDGVLDATIPPAAIEMFDTGDRDSVYYHVKTAGGRLPARGEPPPGRSHPVGRPAAGRQQVNCCAADE